MEATYHVFHRTWWKEATRPGWPNNLEPGAGEKHTIAVGCSWAEARAACDEWNANNERGRFGDRAEFLEE